MYVNDNWFGLECPLMLLTHASSASIIRAACPIKTMTGLSLPRVRQLKSLGVYLINFQTSICSFNQAKRTYYRSFNAIFGEVGSSALQEGLCN
jgi:hypothetical protein